jgi:Kef-type K+ transport system membrane component KefB
MNAEVRATLLVILLVAVTAPLIALWAGRRVRVPGIVLEIGLGIVVGPHVLGWAHPNAIINALAAFGMLLLFFAAGYELDFSRVKGRPAMLGAAGWAASAAIAIGVGSALEASGLVSSALIVALAMTTTAVGAILPMLRDAGETDTAFGRFATAAGAIGEFAPIVVMALVLSETDLGRTAAVIALYGGIAVLAGVLASMAHVPELIAVSRRMMHSSAQLPMRVALLALAAFVFLSRELGLDAVLGAVAAGIVISLAVHEDQREVMAHKVDGIGFGFFIPMFFIVSGMRFDLTALLATPLTLLKVPLFLALFLVVRGTPALLLYRRHLPFNERLATALLCATELPLVVAITTVGVATGKMHAENAAALVGAGMLSVLLFPVLAFRLKGAAASAAPAAAAVADPPSKA